MPANSESANYATMYRSYLDWRHWRSSRSFDSLSSHTCSTRESRYLPVASSVHANPEQHLALAFSSVPLAGKSINSNARFCWLFRYKIWLSRSVISPRVFLRIRPKRIHLSSRSFCVTVHRYVVRCYLFLIPELLIPEYFNGVYEHLDCTIIFPS